MNANRKEKTKKARSRRAIAKIDWERLEQVNGRILDLTALAEKAGVQRRLIVDSKNGVPVTPTKAAKIVEATGVIDPTTYVYFEDEGKSEAELKIGSYFKGWKVENFLGGDVVRDISFKVGMAREEITDRVGRCKVFDLDFDIESQELIKNELGRNPIICHRVKRNNAFPLLYVSGFATKNKYWVIESWEEAETLSDFVDGSRTCKSSVPRIARELASALLALHKSDVVVRCLSPKMVYLRTDGSLLIRDFELATFLGPTKSRKLGESRNIYFADEFDQPDVDHRADMYSWAQIVIFCLTGRRPPSNQGPEFFASLAGNRKQNLIPKKVVAVLRACSELNRDFRKWDLSREKKEFDFSDVLRDIESWE